MYFESENYWVFVNNSKFYLVHAIAFMPRSIKGNDGVKNLVFQTYLLSRGWDTYPLRRLVWTILNLDGWMLGLHVNIYAFNTMEEWTPSWRGMDDEVGCCDFNMVDT